ncbi:MAG: VWA domain-containing protein [Candidatus Acidiferrales bacterium]
MFTRFTAWKAALLAVLVMALAVPPSSIRAFAEQEGPQKAPPDPQSQGQQRPTVDPNQKQKRPEYSIQVESPLVQVDAVVTDQDGNILTGLKKENFRVAEDGEPQQITNFSPTDAPITVVMLMEFSKLGYSIFAYTAKYWATDFISHLKKEDWLAFKTFDMKTHLEVDFTQNKQDVQQAIYQLYFPGFSEANLFDALVETLDEMKDVKGKKAILVMCSGLDTFSKHTLDQTLKIVKQTDVTIFGVGVAQQLAEYADARGQLGAIDRMNFLQGQNQLSTFARMTGGYAWYPQFDGQIPEIFETVAQFLRNQYTIGFIPTNQNNDGKYHKLKVEVVDDSGQPLIITNAKGKKRKIVIYAREGFTAPTGAVSALPQGGPSRSGY